MIEFHSGKPEASDYQRIRRFIPRLRDLYSRMGCTFTLFTLMREPRAQVLSWWNHFKRREGSSLAHIAQRAANEFQSRHHAGWPLPGPAQGSRRAVGSGCSPALLRDAQKGLAAHDIVGLTSRLDEAMRMVSERSGLPYIPQRAKEVVGDYTGIGPGLGRSGARSGADSARARSHHSARSSPIDASAALLSSLPAGMQRVLKGATECDRALYASFAQRFQENASALGLRTRATLPGDSSWSGGSGNSSRADATTVGASASPPIFLELRGRICPNPSARIPNELPQSHWNPRWGVGEWQPKWRAVYVEAYYPACNWTVLRVAL